MAITPSGPEQVPSSQPSSSDDTPRTETETKSQQAANQRLESIANSAAPSRRSSLAGRVKAGPPTSEVSAPPALPYEAQLAAWANNADIKGDKQTAVERIHAALADQSSELDLSELGLTELPPLTALEAQVTILNLEGNKLTNFPAQLLKFSQLTALNLSDNEIKELPADIHKLSKLNGLAINNNQLTTLPKEISQLSSLSFLDLSANNLTSLPEEIGALANLESLDLSQNPELSELPETFRNLSNLSRLECENTAIDDATVDKILGRVTEPHHDETTPLESRLAFWYDLANTSSENLNLQKFDSQQQGVINEWLRRLEETPDFKSNPQEFAKFVCQVLEFSQTDEVFKTNLLLQMEENNADCEDRAAMNINMIYIGWRLATLPPDASIEEKMKILTAGAKTLALQTAIDHALLAWQKTNNEPPPGESVEALLYSVTALKEKLGLLCFTEKVKNPEFAEILMQTLGLKLDNLESSVRDNYVDVLADLSAFQDLANQDPVFKASLAGALAPLDQEQAALDEQLFLPEKERTREGEMKETNLLEAMNKLKSRREAKTHEVTREWAKEISKKIGL
ncbi:MAG: leucine-rich repeat domain-containing protein [Verrucomicrobia bacterium]|nr:leucine-rich repeat domain-containing protein [Verrucomicrobiota bacterium]MBS0645059.1 leucine-rich repeat domain-containing protein [Verrucomicrobiota bacterium]